MSPDRSAGFWARTERDVVESLHQARDIEANMLGAVRAIENATASIERHVETIETLATSIDPLRGSVDRLSETLEQLVTSRSAGRGRA